MILTGRKANPRSTHSISMATAGSGDELKVLGAWASPFLVRVLFALQLKGLRYEYVEVDLKEKNELLLASNPVHKKIPVLIHNGRPISESLVILQYVDERLGLPGPRHPPLRPARPRRRTVLGPVRRRQVSYGDPCPEGKGGRRQGGSGG